MTEPNYKELSKELYEILKELRDVINLFQVPPVLDSKFDRIDNFLHKYEEVTNRGTGRTTILYHKAITEALENPGVVVEFIDHVPHRWDIAEEHVEFIDHVPHRWDIAEEHVDNLKDIVAKLHYDIAVYNDNHRVFLRNDFFGIGR